MVDESSNQIRIADHIRAEELVEDIVLSLLQAKKVVSLDEVLVAVYQALVNSQRPNIETVNNVLKRVCDIVDLPGKARRKGFVRRAETAERGRLLSRPLPVQLAFEGDGEVVGAAASDHNSIIRRIADRSKKQGYDVHVGETEQGHAVDLQEASIPMASSVDFGIPKREFDTIREIDLLVLHGRTIVAAFEVATTVDTANKAINDRYRNLLAALNPGFRLRCHVVVKDEDFKKALRTLNSIANKQGWFADRVRIVKVSELTPLYIDGLIRP
jgi:hypothetical protein